VAPGNEATLGVELTGTLQRTELAAQSLELGARRALGHVEQQLLVVARGYAGDGADLGVAQLPALHGSGDERQRRERPRHPHLLARRDQTHADAPAEPMGAALGSWRPPACVGIELVDIDEELMGGGVDMRGGACDALRELVDGFAVQSRQFGAAHAAAS
jgi:hypothetical protein